MTLTNIMDELVAIVKYVELLILTFIFSMIKTLFFRVQYNIMLNDIICIELLIGIIITQAFLIYVRRQGYLDETHIIYIILINIALTTIAWSYGTTAGLQALFMHPSICHP